MVETRGVGLGYTFLLFCKLQVDILNARAVRYLLVCCLLMGCLGASLGYITRYLRKRTALLSDHVLQLCLIGRIERHY